MGDSQNKSAKATATVSTEPAAAPAIDAVSTTAIAKAVEADAGPASVAKKPKKAATKKAAPKTARRKAAPAAKQATPAAPAAALAKTAPISQLKDTIMATAKTANTTDYTAKAQNMAADMQTRVKAAYEKGTAMTKEAAEFQKGNLEAVVESGKILASGMQDMGRSYAEEAKSAAETVQEDMKKFTAIKSPTELFELQGEIARRNFDAMVSTASKNTEAMLKLVNEAFAPMSNRMSLAAEKVGKAA